MLLPEGATLLGVTLSSDKTNITVMTGDRTAHPVLLTLANIHMDVRMKASNHAFILLALLPCPKFLARDRPTRSVLESRVVHLCLNIITEPLKLAARAGWMMSDPRGYSHFCFTALASYMVDTPEAALIACVAGKTSHLTMADYRKFGEPTRQEPRTASTTLAQLSALGSQFNPLDLSSYIPAAKAIQLNGVHLPFWRDWFLRSPSGGLPKILMADPSQFLTPEPLHHWHKQFWDHDVKWSIRVLGADELDFRFSTIQPMVGFKHFKDGISSLKQVTGRAHRDVERYLIGVIAGKASQPFVITIRALMDFRYLAQARQLDDTLLLRIASSLQLFHDYKQSVLDLGARVGKGNKPIGYFQIPKLELMHSVVPSIASSGAVIQWSANTTERAHITEVKVPGRSGNNQSYNPQICRWLDRSEKHRNFALALSIQHTQSRLRSDQNEDEVDPPDQDLEAEINDDDDDDDNHTPRGPSPTTQHPDLFARSTWVSNNVTPSTPLPLRTFHTETTAFQLNRHPSLKEATIKEIATKFDIPDLCPALTDYVRRARNLGSTIFKIGQRRTSPSGGDLPFTHLNVWYSVRMQVQTTDAIGTTPTQRLCALPPSEGWPFGRYDTVLLSNGTPPGPGLGGMRMISPLHRFLPNPLTPPGFDLAQIRLILHPVWNVNVFLVYAQRFDLIPQPTHYGSTTRGRCPDPVTGMYVTKRSLRSNGARLRDVLPLSQARIPAPLVPRYGDQADPKLAAQNSLEFSTEFHLNHFFDKELYYFMLWHNL